MLRISKLTDYGTVVMACLAKQAPNLCSARDVALLTHLALPTVSKLLKRLTARGLLYSARGTNGGYQLARKPSEISIADIIYALDEQRGLTECSARPKDCVLHHVCHIQSNWRSISHAIETALESVSLEVLAMPELPTHYAQRVTNLAMRVHHE